MPFMAYLALDDPHALTRADFVRLAIVTRPGAPEEFEYSEESLRNFEADYLRRSFLGSRRPARIRRNAHRYWFHSVSNQEQARLLFRRLCDQLRNYELYDEVRTEVMDMSNYLDTDSIRRQANTVLRLTVVTIFGLIGTIVTGFLGMNLLAEAESSLTRRTVLFLLVLAATAGVTSLTIVKSKRLADFIDALSDDRITWKEKWGVWERIWFTPRARDVAPSDPMRRGGP